MDWWHKKESFKVCVEEAWERIKVRGWRRYILKEKLKGLKGCIKSWSKEKSEDVKTQYILCGRKMNELDVKGNEGVG